MLSLLITALKRLNDRRRRHAQLRKLLEKDDRLLEDMGLRRVEILEALNMRDLDHPRDYAFQLSTRSLALDGLR